MASGAAYQISFCYYVLLSIFDLPQSIPCHSPSSSRRGQSTVLFPLSPTSFCHLFLLYQTVQSARFYYLLVKFSEMPEKNKDSLKIIVWTYPRVCCALTEYPHGPFLSEFFTMLIGAKSDVQLTSEQLDLCANILWSSGSLPMTVSASRRNSTTEYAPSCGHG